MNDLPQENTEPDWAPWYKVRLAVAAGDLSTLRTLIEQGTDVNRKDNMDETALHTAVRFDQIEAARILLQHRADVNAQDLLGFTPLIFAAGCGNADMVKLLLDNGADINVTAYNQEDLEKPSESALARASKNGHKEIVQLLENAKAKSTDCQTRKA